MEKKTYTTMYNTHAWVGIISGILLFIVTFSGIPALFEHELEYWQHPVFSQQKATGPLDLERVFAATEQYNFDHQNYFIQPPNSITQHIVLANFDGF